MGGETHINMVSYGGGVNSTALLVGLHQHRMVSYHLSHIAVACQHRRG